VITDTHAHVFWKDFDGDREAVLARARAEGVERMIIVGTTPETSRQCFELCDGQPGLYPTAGVHPHDAEGLSAGILDEIEELCRRPDCVAVGETGLDYFKEYSPARDQRRGFRWHLELARELDKPVIVHCRDANQDTLELLREVPGVRGVMHCYSMGADELAPYLELGMHISFSGSVTYPRNEDNREAARRVPADRILVETDCPFLAPQGKRGKRNEPAYVKLTLEHIAAERETSADEFARQTSLNAARLFGLDGAATD